MSPEMLKSDATPARKTLSAPDGNPVRKDNKRAQAVAGFLGPAQEGALRICVHDQNASILGQQAGEIRADSALSKPAFASTDGKDHDLMIGE